MICIAVCDDDKKELDKLMLILHEWSSHGTENEIQLKAFSSAYALLETVYKGETFDFFILDILMPEMTGIDLGERLREIYAEPLLIYLTSSEDYYPDAFKVYAFQYICKPIRKAVFFDILDKAFEKASRRLSEFVSIKSAEGTISIPIHNIIYAELLNHICYFHLSDQTHIQSRYLRGRFNDFVAPLLLNPNFEKPHSSYVVNIRYVLKLASNSLTLSNGAKLPIARSYLHQFRRCYMDYALRENINLQK